MFTSDMAKGLDPFRFLLIAVAGWMNQEQLRMIEYLREENRVLREQLGGRRLSFSDEQRRQLAVRAKIRTESPRAVGYYCHARHTARLAPTAHRIEVRRKREARARATAKGRGDRDVSGPVGRREQDLGLPTGFRERAPTLGIRLLAALLRTSFDSTALNRHRNEAARRVGRSFWLSTGT